MTLCWIYSSNRALFRRTFLVFSSNKYLRNMSAQDSKFDLPARYSRDPNVWTEFQGLGLQYKPVNLGQGFPDFLPPRHVTENLCKVLESTDNPLVHQYGRSSGHLRLVTVLSKLYSKMVGREINPMTEIVVTAGAYEALFCGIMGHLSQGEEAILVEPFFDCYLPMIRSAGGKAVFVPLRCTKTSNTISSGDWQLDPDELAKLFNERTKLIILNNPHNPTGKVFTLEEITMIADLCKKWNVMCISDEVYEWLAFEPNKHIRTATLPGMWERTITIGSGGKTFSVTGWKTGWAYGPANLIHNLSTVHSNTVNSCVTPVQESMAMSLEFELSRFGEPDCYLQSLAREVKKKSEYMVKFLTEAGMIPVVPQSGYFLMADWTPLRSKVKLEEETDKYEDYRFAKWMVRNVLLLGIPPAAFYSEEHKHLAANYNRYCFIKQDAYLERAAKVLIDWTKSEKV